jgi:hypothetical protein
LNNGEFTDSSITAEDKARIKKINDELLSSASSLNEIIVQVEMRKFSNLISNRLNKRNNLVTN